MNERSDIYPDFEDEQDKACEDATSEREYASLDQAFEAHRIPMENRDLIRRAVALAGVERYTGTASYIKAHRNDGGPTLRIHYGYTNGFRSADEAASLGDGVQPWRSARTKLWGISHPVNRTSSRAGGQKQVRRDYGVCPECFTTYHPNGTCGCV